MSCPLCAGQSDYFTQDRRRRFFHCLCCGLIVADTASLLSPTEEKKLYDLHENNPTDSRYQAFLNQLAQPLAVHLQPGMRGLDFGCGPGPAMQRLLTSIGVTLAQYDPVYFPESGLLKQTYDFITCTEVVEHFHQPARDWMLLSQLIRPGGWLGVMTWMVIQPAADWFHGWGYKGDPTHVSFYQPQTMEWIGQQFGFEVNIVSQRVILMRKR